MDSLSAPVASGSSTPSRPRMSTAPFISSPLHQVHTSSPARTASPNVSTGPTVHLDHATEEDEAMVESALLDDQQGLRSTMASGSSSTSSPRKARASASGSRRQSRASNAGSAAATSPRKSRGSVVPTVVTPQQQEEAMIQDEEEEKHDQEEIHSSGQSMLEEEQGEAIRLRRLNEGLVRFLGLVDVKATQENFSAAFPHISSESMDPLRTQLISDLKQLIQEEHSVLLEDYLLHQKLPELQRLSLEADRRAAKGLPLDHEEMKDVWRAELDITTALNAKAVIGQRLRVKAMERELKDLEASNARLYGELQAKTSEADGKQAEAKVLLDVMDRVVDDLQMGASVEKQLKGNLEALASELGPRA